MVNVKTVINDLVGFKNIKIVQCRDYFNFSLDSVLLPNFCVLNKNVKKILDIGCGNCPVSIILSLKCDAEITAVELQKEIYDLAEETLRINQLEKRINLINEDIKDYSKKIDTDSYDLIVSNPPYFKIYDKTLKNENIVKSIARHEITLTLEDIIIISKKLLKNNASLVLVHRTDRLSEIINLMKKNNIEPKRIRFVYPKENTHSNMVLIEGKKNAKEGLKVLPPLITHNNDGSYTEEVKKCFHERGTNDTKKL